jgi:hypothetical protein
MPGREHFISIWYFIGLLLLAYGVLITGAGIYELFIPADRQVAMAHLHAGIWWGTLLLVLGGLYCYHFSPGKAGRD